MIAAVINKIREWIIIGIMFLHNRLGSHAHDGASGSVSGILHGGLGAAWGAGGLFVSFVYSSYPAFRVGGDPKKCDPIWQRGYQHKSRSTVGFGG